MRVVGGALRRLEVVRARPFAFRTCSSARGSGKGKGKGEEGWPLKVKLAGGAALAVAVPGMVKYAIEHDRETRDLAEKLAPWAVGKLRARAGGHFDDENASQRARDAHLLELYALPVSAQVTCRDGATIEVTLNAEEPLREMVRRARCSAGIEDFCFLDVPGSAAENEGRSDSFFEVADPEDGHDSSSISEEVRLAGIRSWWNLARVDVQEEKRQQVEKLQAANISKDGIKALRNDLQRQIENLEWEKQHGNRSIDDIDEDIAMLRRRDAGLRRDARRGRWWRLGWG